jgi:DNA-binding winged helix-turn-helix (wHTH) protein/tetratricopeptide (TPR) repeat protein
LLKSFEAGVPRVTDVDPDRIREINFGRFQLDLQRRRLYCDSSPVRLGRRSLDILCELAAAGGGVVGKGALMDRLWPDRAVEEGNIHVHVSALRRALGAHGDGHSYVVTVPGRGYRLAGIGGSDIAGLAALAAADTAAASEAVADASDPEAAASAAPAAPAVEPAGLQRRQLTVMSCELIGTARLAAADPEDLGTALRTVHRLCSEIVGRFGGTVIQLTGGTLLGYFGYPQAGEHDAEQAVRAGLALIEAVRGRAAASPPLEVRLGIATGAVIVGDGVAPHASAADGLVGETIGVVAALRRTAEPNRLVIAGSTRRLVGALFEVQRRPDVGLERSDTTIEAYDVLASSAIDSRFEALRGAPIVPLVGREEEIELLQRRWQRAKSGELRVVLLTGESGIGKSRLCVELQQRIASEPHAVIRYFCSPHHADSALYPVIRQLELACGFSRSDRSGDKRNKLRALLTRDGPVSEEDLNLLADMLSLPTPQPVPAGESTARRKRDLTFEALLRLLEAAAARRPVLMVVEDAHWSDPTTLELLDLALRRSAHRQVLFVITFRPEFAAPWTAQSYATTLTLRRLDRTDGAALVRRLIGERTLPDAVVDAIVARSDGVPLFLEELSKALAEADPGAAAVDPARTIPSTLQASLMARFDRLDAATKDVAQLGAAIGREFSYELLSAVFAASPERLDPALAQLVASGLVRCRGQPPNAVFEFKHGLVQDTVYATLLRTRRRQRHGEIAGALLRLFPEVVAQQPELLAHHLTEAEQPDLAAGFWRSAVERALRTSAYREAVSHSTHGLQVVEAIGDRDARLRQEASLQLQRGIALTASLGPSAPEMFETFNRAREIAEELAEDRPLASALLGLWAHHNARANLEAALALAQRLYDIGRARNEPALRAQAHAASLTVNFKMGRFATAWEHFQHGTALYRPGMRIIEAIPNYTSPGPDMLLHGAFVAWVMGYPERARRLAAETMTAARKLNQPYTLTHCVYMLGHLAELQDDWPAVRRANQETVELATRWGFAGTLQLVERRIGLVAVAIDRDEEQLDVKCEHRQPGFARSLHDVVLARTCGDLGMAKRGLRLLDEALAVTRVTGSCFYDAEVHRTHGALLAALGRRSDAERAYAKSLEVARQQQARLWELRTAIALARLWGDAGERRRAVDLLAPVHAWFTEGRDVPELRAAAALLGDLS